MRSRLSLARRLGLLTLVAAACSVAAQEPPGGAAPTDSVTQAIDAGRYDDAERLAAARIAGTAGEFAPDSLPAAAAADAWVRARLLNGKAASQDTLDAAARALHIREGPAASDAAGLVTSLLNLADLRAARGEAPAALPLYVRALELSRGQSAAHPILPAEALNRQAATLILLQRYRDAERALDESRQLQGSGADSPLTLARTHYLLALLRRNEGQLPPAAEALEQALDIRRRLLPPDHPDVRVSLQLLGQLQYLRGDIPGARSTWQSTLQIAERTLRPDHPDIAEILRFLALAARAVGELVPARQLLDRALPIAQASLTTCNPELSALWVDTATTMYVQNDYIPAQKLYAQALTNRERCLGPNDQRTATVVYNQAFLAREMGDLALSEQLHRRAIRMWTAGLGANHPYVARGLDALASVVAARGDTAGARALYERALEMRQRSLGAEHPDVAWTMTNIAEFAEASGQHKLAAQRIDQAVDLYRRVGAGAQPDRLARSLTLQGRFALARGDFSHADPPLNEALALRQSILGPSHPVVAEARVDLARLALAIGEPAEAIRSALDAESIGRDHLRFTIRYLPERQALAFAADRPGALAVALSALTAGDAEPAFDVLDNVIQSRGVILDELAVRQNTSTGGDSEFGSLNASVAALRAKFANLILRSVEDQNSVPVPLLEETRRAKEDAERDLAERSAAVRAEVNRARIGLDAVVHALPADAALVSYVRFNQTTWNTTAGRTSTRVRPSFIAFVVTPGASGPAVVPLGPASLIERDVASLHREIQAAAFSGTTPQESERTYRVVSSQLRRRVWDPVAKRLGGVSHVFIVPDGALNLVSFASLAVGADSYLIENGPVMHLLPAERDLVRDDTVATGRGLLAVGGPSYDSQLPTALAPGRLRSGCAGVGPLRFEDLPGSRAEVTDIAKLWPAGVGGAADASSSGVTVLSGPSATKNAVTRAARGRRVLHLATHGFFLGADCAPAPPSTRGVGGLAGRGSPSPALADNPLLASGLAFAGANNRASARAGQDAGILTAEEVTSLDLQGVEWAVLSACDTGLGEIRAGEGVFGLRRALQIAGVRTIIMSLWAVQDQATRTWMRTLYTERFHKGASTADAVHTASLQVLRGRRARGQSTHPFYWAAFVAAGDWR